MTGVLTQYPGLISIFALGLFLVVVLLISRHIIKATNSEIQPPKNDLERNLRIIGIFDRDIDRWIIVKNLSIRLGVFFLLGLILLFNLGWILRSLK